MEAQLGPREPDSQFSARLTPSMAPEASSETSSVLNCKRKQGTQCLQGREQGRGTCHRLQTWHHSCPTQEGRGLSTSPSSIIPKASAETGLRYFGAGVRGALERPLQTSLTRTATVTE